MNHTYQLIFDKLKLYDKQLTQEIFSIDYLGRSYHYMSMCKAKGVDISDAARLALYRNLRGLSHSWKEIATSNPNETTNGCWENHKFFLKLASLVLADMMSFKTH